MKATPTVRRPAALNKLMAAAKAKPVGVDSARLDTASCQRREYLGEMKFGELVALLKNSKYEAHRLQRNTLERAHGHRGAHLRCLEAVPAPQHHISLVWFRNQLGVVDGNTRLALWTDLAQDVMIPASVFVTMYYPKNEQEYDMLYRCFDSSESKKSNQDNLYGILRAVGVTPASPLLQAGKVVSAVAFLSARKPTTPEVLLEEARKNSAALQELDSYGFSAHRRFTYSSGVWVGLMSLFNQGVDRKVLRAFAQELVKVREVKGFEASPAVAAFIADYRAIPSPGVAGNIRRVRAALEARFAEFQFDAAFKRTARRKSTPALKKAA